MCETPSHPRWSSITARTDWSGQTSISAPRTKGLQVTFTVGYALILDHILGATAHKPGHPAYTGTLSLRYVRGTRLGELHAEARVVRLDGVKTFAVGHIADSEGVTVEAEGVFITQGTARRKTSGEQGVTFAGRDWPKAKGRISAALLVELPGIEPARYRR